METFSILMPAWGSAKYIRQAIRSVLTQDLPPGWQVELLVGVDACSETLRMVFTMPPHDRLQVFSASENVGAYVIRNSLLSRTTGSLLAVVDSDDVLLPGTLAAAISYADSHPETAIFSWGSTSTDENLKSIEHTGGQDGAVCYRREVFDALGGWEPWRCGADSEFLQRALHSGFTRSRLDHVGTLYRQRPGQLTQVLNRQSPERLVARAEIARRVKEWESS